MQRLHMLSALKKLKIQGFLSENAGKSRREVVKNIENSFFLYKKTIEKQPLFSLTQHHSNL
jgi:hypothetical protein